MAEILNLVNPNDTLSFKYEISKFPDGQQSLRLIENGYNSFQSLRDSDSAHGIRIYSRLNTFSDLEIIICATQALKEAGVKNISLYIPYCIGARSDRKFMEGGMNYVKHVIAPIINLQGYSKVTILDPHSDVLEACINNFEKKDNLDLVKFALTKIDNTNEAREKMVIISPDAGALKKIYNVAEHFDINKVLIAAKHRDIKTGRITHTEVPGLDSYRTDSNFVIIDDICDGGRTFTEIAKVIQSHVWPHDEYFRGKIYLVVTHGIFSAGYAQLGEYFEAIYTTNSVKDVAETEYHALENTPTKVKQQNVF
jgi:ribose-phosphate pyrophosphokinase